MTTENDELDSSWDSLADELGVDATAKPAADPIPPPAPRHHHPAPAHRAPKPEPEAFEEDDFGGGLEEAPKAEEFAEDLDGEEGGEEEGSGEETAEGVSEEGEGKKKRRRRRRRRKKGGANPAEGAAAPADVESAEGDSGEYQAVGEAAAEEETVEEGDAPAEMGDSSEDDDDRENLSAVDEEMNTAGNGPRQEWKVMSWNELVGKLHRPN